MHRTNAHSIENDLFSPDWSSDLEALACHLYLIEDEIESSIQGSLLILLDQKCSRTVLAYKMGEILLLL